MFDERLFAFLEGSEINSLPKKKKRGKKNMKSSVNIPVIVYFNGYIIRTGKKCVTFICNESIYFRIPQTI